MAKYEKKPVKKKPVKKKQVKKATKTTRAEELRSKMAKLDAEYDKINDSCDVNRTSFRDLEKELDDIETAEFKKNGVTAFLTEDDFLAHRFSDARENLNGLIEDLRFDGFSADIIKVTIKPVKPTKEEQKRIDHYKAEAEEDY